MYQFYTGMDIERCKRTIDHQIASDAYVPGNICGKVNYESDSFHIQKINKKVRNSFARRFYGRLIEHNTGTILKGNFRMHPLIQAFLLVWFGGITVATAKPIIQYVESYSTSNPEALHISTLNAPIIMLVFGAILVFAGRLLSKKEEEYILKHLTKILHLRDVKESSKPANL